MFRVDDYPDSDPALPPSTPDRSRRSARFASPSNVSTTPAGPPPTSLTGQSTTPAGPPPASSLFGGSSARLSAPSFSAHDSSFARNVPSSPPPLVQSRDIMTDEDHDFNEDFMEEDDPAEDDFFMPFSLPAQSQRPAARRPGLDIAAVARSMVPRARSLRETDAFNLDSESIMDKLWHTIASDNSDYVQKDKLAAEAADRLVRLWCPPTSKKFDALMIGPGDKADAISKAGFVASLVLPIHHQPAKNPRRGNHDIKSMPKVLIDWMQAYHWPFRRDLTAVLNHRPNCTAHERFWDIIYNTALRCDLTSVIALLKGADWTHAATAVDDGSETTGYSGKQLANTQRVVKRCISLLEMSPAIKHGDYDVSNADWTIFRKRVEQASAELETFAEGASADRYSTSDPRRSRGGAASKMGRSLSLSQQSRQAESQVPWSVYTNLKYLYGQLLGTRSELSAAASDWVEATLGYTIWWDGKEDQEASEELLKQSLSSSRRLLTRSGSQRLVDVNPHEAYLKQLAANVAHFLGSPEEEDEEELQVNTSDAVCVALACALSGENEALLDLLTGWSPVIGTAVTELADLGSWLDTPSADLMGNFDQSDLMVLSYGGQKSTVNKRDQALILFADLLAQRDSFQHSGERPSRPGWQLAVEVLGRLHDRSGSMQRITDLLEKLRITDSLQVNETSGLCRRLGLSDEASRISTRYADHLTATTTRYGEAIFYYVRGRSSQKIKELLNTLSTLSITQSTCYPPTRTLDKSMGEFLASPKQTLSQLRQLDPANADTIMTHVSGYATVRKYYDIRDDAARRPMSALSRRKAAATLLITLVQSAADPIHGGLYDARTASASAIPVDALLPLLGEALAFVGVGARILAQHQLLALLKAVEDLAASSASIRARADAALAACLAAAHASDSSPPASPRALLRKAASADSGGFSLIGSEMLRSTTDAAASSNGAADDAESAVLVPPPHFPRRAWDWRAGFERGASADDVLRVLRLQVAREMAAAWTAPLGV